MEVFVRAADVKLVHVPYQGSGPAMTGVVAGDVHAALDNVAAVPLVKGGKLRALAQTGKARSASLPDVPTFAEAGLPQFDVTGSWGLLAPAGVPPKRSPVSDALARAVNDQAFVKRCSRKASRRSPDRAAIRVGARERIRQMVATDRAGEHQAVGEGDAR